MRARLSLAVVVALACAAPGHATGFLSAIEDIPLMEGLSETAEPVVFESAFGRVVQTTARGSAKADAVREFYAAALPALGWMREGASLDFLRENERLTISVRDAAGSGPVSVTFELVAKLAPSKLPE
jgi:hypothetical protein